jgi:hypothetical protein
MYHARFLLSMIVYGVSIDKRDIIVYPVNRDNKVIYESRQFIIGKK